MCLTDAYDAVYVINLDRSHDRLLKMTKQLNDMGIHFKRFNAIDGTQIKIVNAKTGKVEDTKSFTSNKNFENNAEYEISFEDISIKYKTDITRWHLYLGYGEIACAMSHLAVMKDIIKNNFRKTIIFEDDVIFKANFIEDLKQTLDNTPNDFDILFFDFQICPFFVDFEISLTDRNFIHNKRTLSRNFNLIPNNKYVVELKDTNDLYGLHSYCVTLEGAKKIIASVNPLIEPIDLLLFWRSEINKTRCYVARKKMLNVSGDFEGSVIGQMGRPFCVVEDNV